MTDRALPDRPEPRRARAVEPLPPRTTTLERSSPAPVAAPPGRATAGVPVRTLRVLVVSADALERQELALELTSADDLEISSASGFHMAVPTLWESRPDVLVVGTLTAADATRLDELGFHAGRAALLLLPSAPHTGGPLTHARRLRGDEALLDVLDEIVAR